METLATLLGGEARLRLLQLLLWHPGTSFTVDQLAVKSKLKPEVIRKELGVLVAAKIARVKPERGKRAWTLLPRLALLPELKSLLAAHAALHQSEIVRRVKAAGRVRYLVVAGLFINKESRVDILAVGDKLKKPIIERLIADLEAALGRELTYAVLGTEDYLFRLHSSDRFVRDILDYPHLVLIDRLPGP